MVVTCPGPLAAKYFLALGLVWTEKLGIMEESTEAEGLEKT